MIELEALFYNLLLEFGSLKGKNIILGVSGGADSLALLLLLSKFQKLFKYKLLVVGIDHGLREEAESELKNGFSLAYYYKIPYRFLKCDVPIYCKLNKLSIEEGARILRYNLFYNIAREKGDGYIAVAHTSNDLNETIILRLKRGSGIGGIAGMQVKDGIIIRPLLNIKKESIKDYLRKLGIRYADDPSNKELRFERVRVREVIVPELKKLNPNLEQLLKDISTKANLLNKMLEKLSLSWLLRYVIQSKRGFFFLKKDIICYPPSIISELIRRLYLYLKGDVKFLTSYQIDSILNGLYSSSYKKIDLPRGLCFEKDETICFIGKKEEYNFIYEVSNNNSNYILDKVLGFGIKLDNKNSLTQSPKNLFIRNRKKGDKIYGSSEKLKDLLIDLKVPRILRNMLPLIVLKDQIVAIPGLWISKNGVCELPYSRIRLYLTNNSPLKLFLRCPKIKGKEENILTEVILI